MLNSQRDSEIWCSTIPSLPSTCSTREHRPRKADRQAAVIEGRTPYSAKTCFKDRPTKSLTGECSDLEPRWLMAMSRLVKRSIRVMRSRRGRPLFAVESNDMNGSKVVESSSSQTGALRQLPTLANDRQLAANSALDTGSTEFKFPSVPTVPKHLRPQYQDTEQCFPTC